MTATLAQLDPALWQDLIGAPFVDKGRGPGYDCLGILLAVHRRMGFDVRDPVEAYAHRTGETFRDQWAQSWRKSDKPKIGTAVLWRKEQGYHVGVIVGPDRVLHTTEKTGAIVQRFDPESATVLGLFEPGDGLPDDAPIECPGITAALFGGGLLGALGAFAANLAIGGIIGFLANLIARPEKTKLDRGEETRPTFDLGGARLTVASGTTRPVVYGEHIVGGHVVQLFFRAGTDLRTRLYMLIAVSEGEVYSIGGQTADANNLPSSAFVGDAVTINGNPIANYPTARVSVRMGSLTQSPIPGFDETVVSQNVGSFVRHTLGVPAPNNVIIAENVDTVAVTTTDDIDAFEINLQFPNGLFGQDGSGNSQNYQWFGTLRYYPVGNPSNVSAQLITIGPTQIKADHTRTIRVNNLTRDKYRISLTRSSLEDNEASNPRTSLCRWTTLNEISMTQALARPGKALLAIEALATDQLSGSIPQVASIVKGRVVQIWDGLSTTAPTFTRAWSDNPARISLDVLLNKRYGLGSYVRLNEIDLQSLEDWADYCDASITTDGTTHARWQFDHVFDVQQSAWDVLNQLAAAGRASIIYNGGKFRWVVDTTASYSQIFGMGNIVAGSYAAEYGNASRNPNFIELQYLNRDTGYEQDVAQLDAATATTDSVRKESIRLVGITRSVHAYRATKHALNVSQANLKRLRFTASIDAIAVEPGDVFRFAHDVPQIGYSGRVKTATHIGGSAARIQFDRPLTIGSGWTFVFRSSTSGAEAFVALTTATPGTYAAGTNVSFSGITPGQTPMPDDVWMAGPTATYYRDYRVIAKRLLPDFLCEIEAIEYDATVYDDDPGVIEEFTDQWPDSREIIDPPSAVSAQEIARVLKDGTVAHDIEVTFKPSRAGLWHDVFYRFACAESGQDDFFGEEWNHAGSTRDQSLRFSHGTTYQRTAEISVAPRNVAGSVADPNSGTRAVCFVGGRVDGPSAPSNLSTQSIGDRLLISFDAASSKDVARYEFRQSSAADRWLFAPKIARCGCNSPALAWAESFSSSYLLGKAISTSGIPSETVASLAVTPSRLSGKTLISDVISGSDWTATGTADTNFTLTGGNLVSDAAATSAEWTSDVDGHCLALKHVRIHAHLDAKGTDTVSTWSDAWWAWDALQVTRRVWGGEVLDDVQPEEYATWEERVDTWASPTSEALSWGGSFSAYSIVLEYALATDAAASSFGSWIEYDGPFETKSNWWVKWRVTFTSAAGNYGCELLGLTVTAFDLAAGNADTPVPSDTAVVIDDHFVFSSTENGEIGDYGWTLSGTSATAAIGARNLDTHPGQVEIATVATSGNYASIHTNSTSGHIILGTAVLRFMARVYVVDSASFTVIAGLTSSVSSTTPNGVYITGAASGNWSCTVKKAAGTTNNNSGVAVTTGWWQLEFCVFGSSQVIFKITNEAGSMTTVTSAVSNLDVTTALALCIGVHTSANATKTISIDRAQLLAEQLAL